MFVHSLVKVDCRNSRGWRAPIELGDAAPGYIGFVVPLGGGNEFADEYTCEVAKITSRGREHEVRKLIKTGTDSFVLELSPDAKLWFHVRAVGRNERRLPYVGNLRHDDFKRLLTEIVPDQFSEMDELCDQRGTFIIGCDPERHYAGLARSLGSGR